MLIPLRLPTVTGGSLVERTPIASRTPDARVLGQLHACVLRYLRACASREKLLTNEDAQDLASDVMERLLPRLSELDHPERYAMTMSRHRLLRFLRQARRRHACEHEWGSDRAYGVIELSRECSWRLDDRRFFQLLVAKNQLAIEDTLTRQLVRFRCQKDMTYRQIAELVSEQPAALRMRVSRFKGRVQKRWSTKAGCVVRSFDA
ncbi:MAG: hypothetical protein OXT73_01570 [Bacteroidota bacterium]|nr:hypothetical protein [Bacteroidota bacterium]